jgi:geranylgeranyl reductase
MQKEYREVVIVGAGPAGLKAAKILAENGKDVLLLEKVKEEDIGNKICGGYPSNRILGYIPDTIIDFAPTEFKLHRHGKTISVGFSNGSPFARVIERRTLGQYQLKEAKRAGAEIKCESGVINVSLKDKKVTIENGEEFNYNYLIGADGASSIVRKTLGFPIDEVSILQYIVEKRVSDVEVFLNRRKLGLGYGWIFPHKDSTYIGVGGYEPPSLEEKRQNFVRIIDNWLKENNINLENEEVKKHAINLAYHGFKFKNVFLVGDAAGLVLEATWRRHISCSSFRKDSSKNYNKSKNELG